MSNANRTVVDVEETLTGRYVQTARTGRHALTVDEPKAGGGVTTPVPVLTNIF